MRYLQALQNYHILVSVSQIIYYMIYLSELIPLLLVKDQEILLLPHLFDKQLVTLLLFLQLDLLVDLVFQEIGECLVEESV